MTLNDRLYGQFSINPVKYAAAPTEARWNAQEPWCPMGHRYEWILVDYTLGMRADAAWLVGHYQLDDTPGFYLAAALELTDHPGFYLAYAYKRNDTPGEFLAQAYRRDDQPGMYMPAVETLNDHVGFYVVAVRELHDQPGSYLVRGVNADGVIEVSIVDADAWAELVARGYSRG
jgi:hypothetical protein